MQVFVHCNEDSIVRSNIFCYRCVITHRSCSSRPTVLDLSLGSCKWEHFILCQLVRSVLVNTILFYLCNGTWVIALCPTIPTINASARATIRMKFIPIPTAGNKISWSVWFQLKPIDFHARRGQLLHPIHHYLSAGAAPEVHKKSTEEVSRQHRNAVQSKAWFTAAQCELDRRQ